MLPFQSWQRQICIKKMSHRYVWETIKVHVFFYDPVNSSEEFIGDNKAWRQQFLSIQHLTYIFILDIR